MTHWAVAKEKNKAVVRVALVTPSYTHNLILYRASVFFNEPFLTSSLGLLFLFVDTLLDWNRLI